MSKSESQAQPLFAVLKGGSDGVPVVIVAIHEGTWEHLRNGNTVHFDFSGVGVLAKLAPCRVNSKRKKSSTSSSKAGRTALPLRAGCRGPVTRVAGEAARP